MIREEDDQLYIYKLYGLSIPRVMKADKSLRGRIGPTAKIQDEQIKKAQEIIDQSPYDFKPYAMDYVRSIRSAIEVARMESYLHEEEYDQIITPLIQIKGQAGMFGNALASEISTMVLKFVEHYKRLDHDMLLLLEVYCNVIELSYDKKLYEIEASGSKMLITEISNAMQRYRDKFKKMTGR